MRARDIILEGYDRQKTLLNYGEKISARIASSMRGDKSVSDGMVKAALAVFEDADPTPKKAFVLDLVRWFLDGSMRFVEDASKAKMPLTLYSKFRNRGLPALKSLSFSQLLDLGDSLQNTLSKSEANKAEEQGFYDRNEALLLRDTPEYKVITPLTMSAAQYFGRGTRWCTASENNNMFHSYHDKPRGARLYIVLFKGRIERWQIHVQSGQFMDARDETIDRDDWLEEKDFVDWFYEREIKNSLGYVNELEALASYIPDYEKDLSVNQQCRLVGRFQYIIRHFKNAHDDVVEYWAEKHEPYVLVRAINTTFHHLTKEKMEKAVILSHGPENYFNIDEPTETTKNWFPKYITAWLDREIKRTSMERITIKNPATIKFMIAQKLIRSDELEQQLKKRQARGLGARYYDYEQDA